MRVVKSVLLAIMFLLISNGMHAQFGEKLPDTNKKMPFEHGSYVVVINTLGMLEMMDGEITVYFDRWGDWIAIEEIKSEENMTGDTVKIHLLTILKGNTCWDIDLTEKTGTMRELTIEDIAVLSSWIINFETVSISTFFKEMFEEKMEVKEIGREEYLGYICKIKDIKYPPTKSKSRKQKKEQVKDTSMAMKLTTLTYGNLAMKTEMKMEIKSDIAVMRMEMSSKITSINLDAPPASVFEVPDDVEIEVLEEEVEIEE